jgi:hypothetical protein
MIVNYTASGWEIITQRAHGLLSAKIAQAWTRDIRTGRWTETLLAIAEHDDGQVELEQDDLLTEQGGPINFKMKDYDPAHCRRTLDFALSKSRYIALLCAMHLEFVYGKPGRGSPMRVMAEGIKANKNPGTKRLRFARVVRRTFVAFMSASEPARNAKYRDQPGLPAGAECAEHIDR